MARIKCPNCGKIKTIKGRYNHHFDDEIECAQCGLKVSGFCWDYIHRVRKEKDPLVTRDKDTGNLKLTELGILFRKKYKEEHYEN